MLSAREESLLALGSEKLSRASWPGAWINTRYASIVNACAAHTCSLGENNAGNSGSLREASLNPLWVYFKVYGIWYAFALCWVSLDIGMIVDAGFGGTRTPLLSSTNHTFLDSIAQDSADFPFSLLPNKLTFLYQIRSTLSSNPNHSHKFNSVCEVRRKI